MLLKNVTLKNTIYEPVQDSTSESILGLPGDDVVIGEVSTVNGK